ncbi:MAG: DNRLRE domain-containing protein, partial [Actinomycetota bacterium]|nr:DNRLRE domain-containing protein [Actinomycetota bacterium]
MGVLAGLTLLVPRAETATTATATFAPVADAYVDQAAPRKRFGGATELRVGPAPGELRSYLRFDLSGLQGTVVRATLRLSPNTPLIPSFDVRGVANNSWKETGIYWGNAPPMGSSVIGASTVAPDGWATVDVTPLVSGRGLLSMGLTSSGGTRISLASREVASRAPQLVVETDPGSGDTTAPTVTLTQPANGGTTSDTTPTFAGAAGEASGDSATVTVKLYSGTTASGTPVQTLSATRSGGAWSVDASSALEHGTYTAQAEQSDAAGNTGQSSANTFTVQSASTTTSYRDEVMSDGPRGYWRLGESSG